MTDSVFTTQSTMLTVNDKHAYDMQLELCMYG